MSEHSGHSYGRWSGRQRRPEGGLIVALAVMMVLLASCASTSNGNSASASTNVSRTSAAGAPRATSPASSSAPSTSSVALLQQDGVGDGTTKEFTVGRTSWSVSWGFYDCGNAGQGHFEVEVAGPGASGSSAYPPITAFAVSYSGTQRYPGPGTYQLVVATPCAWTLSVQQ